MAESAVVEEVSAEVPDHAVGEEGEEEEEEELREAAETAAPTSGDGLHQLPTER